jgi:uncharacterized protein YbdZ (MbtH family)
MATANERTYYRVVNEEEEMAIWRRQKQGPKK